MAKAADALETFARLGREPMSGVYIRSIAVEEAIQLMLADWHSVKS